MRWHSAAALLSWLLLATALAPWMVVEAEGTGCDRVIGGPERCTHHERTISYRLLGPLVEDVRTVEGEEEPRVAAGAWTARWHDLKGPATASLQLGAWAAAAGAVAFPLAVASAHRRPRRSARTGARAAWTCMAAGAGLYAVAALAHAARNGADRGWPGWGALFVVAALLAGVALRSLPEPAADGGPLPALPSFG